MTNLDCFIGKRWGRISPLTSVHFSNVQSRFQRSYIESVQIQYAKILKSYLHTLGTDGNVLSLNFSFLCNSDLQTTVFWEHKSTLCWKNLFHVKQLNIFTGRKGTIDLICFEIWRKKSLIMWNGTSHLNSGVMHIGFTQIIVFLPFYFA